MYMEVMLNIDVPGRLYLGMSLGRYLAVVMHVKESLQLGEQ